ncbi:UDP-4-amino-4,6-dideoxy-N-acetyl-beta-L-altrosamine transaminase [Clostridiaceae bacterium M8S5]|nr:UDP-4-amino-4,6-dideoxy-N-acetyl-beta-L-altrosamine transaminase [Clostridiaceae bacterium M8S5]
MKYIPYGKQWIDEEDIKAVIEILKADYITTGPKVAEFEQKFASYVGAKYAVAISNGTAALHAACHAAGIREGDEVITSPITFAASANAVIYCKGTPVFADINTETYNIDVEDIKRKITNKTKAIIPVHFTGQPCDMDELLKLADEYNLKIIEDASHALGATYKDSMIGCISDMTTFSFHPVKHITTGEGGMITTNNKELYEKLSLFRTHGITRNINTSDLGDWYYEQVDLGYNYRITDIQCALGISQLSKIESFVERRRAIAKKYDEELSKIDEIIVPYQDKNTKSSYHLYVIKLKLDRLKVGRKHIFDELKKSGIGVNVHYIPVYYHPYYKELGYVKGLCEKAEELYDRMITIPLYPQMSDSDVEQVINALKKTIDRYSKL